MREQVMCAHKDHTFMEAAKVKAQHLDGQNGPIPPLDSMAALTGDPTELPVITDLPALPADSPASPHPTSVNRFPLAMGEHFEGQHSGIPSRLGSLYQNPREAGSSSSLQSYAEHGDDGDGGFHFRQPSIREERQAERGFSDRHRNSSAVSLSSLAGSDVSTGSTTYVTELPEGSSLFYKGPHGVGGLSVTLLQRRCWCDLARATRLCAAAERAAAMSTLQPGAWWVLL